MNGKTMTTAMCAAVLASLTLAFGCGGDVSREIARSGFDVETEIWADAPTVAVDDVAPHEGAGSLNVFADGRLRVPFMDAPVSDVVGDSLTVTLWARTEVMQRPVILEMILDRAEGDPRLVQVSLERVERTTPWSFVQAAFDVLPDETPTRVRLALVVPEPGRIWIDDVTVWDGVAASPARSE